MKAKLPILILIPHGGYKIPDELAGFEAVSEFDIFFQSDTCANDLFAFEENAVKVDSLISRLFVDIDRPETSLGDEDGVIKKSDLYGKSIYRDDVFPDEIAVVNILKRYYLPFYRAAEKTIKNEKIRLILDCHTHMPVGPKKARDPGEPRPVVLVENRAVFNKKEIVTCPDDLAAGLVQSAQKAFAEEDASVSKKIVLSGRASGGYLHAKIGASGIPMIRLSLSKALFLNDTHFNYDYLKVDEIRLKELKDKIWSALDKFFHKNFK